MVPAQEMMIVEQIAVRGHNKEPDQTGVEEKGGGNHFEATSRGGGMGAVEVRKRAAPFYPNGACGGCLCNGNESLFSSGCCALPGRNVPRMLRTPNQGPRALAITRSETTPPRGGWRNCTVAGKKKRAGGKRGPKNERESHRRRRGAHGCTKDGG